MNFWTKNGLFEQCEFKSQSLSLKALFYPHILMNKVINVVLFSKTLHNTYLDQQTRLHCWKSRSQKKAC